MTNKILLIHTNRKTQAYRSYQTYSSNQISKEELLKKVEEYNSNPENNTTVKVYEDDLLLNLIEDVRVSYKRRNFVSDLKDFMYELDSDICSLQNVYDDIETLIKELENPITLNDIKEIAKRIIEDYDGNQADKMQEEAELIIKTINEVQCEV